MIPKRIIIHHSLTEDNETLSWQAIRRYHIDHNKWDDVGYHFGIELVNNDYEVLVGRMLNQTGAHCFGHNRETLGICLVGNFDDKPVPAKQWDIAVRLVSGLLVLMNECTGIVHGHREYSGKSCPGKLFDMNKFKKDVGMRI